MIKHFPLSSLDKTLRQAKSYFPMDSRDLERREFIAILLSHFGMFVNKGLQNEEYGEQTATNALHTGKRSLRTKGIGSQLLL